MIKNIVFVLLTVLALSCSPPRTLYISNKLDHRITLVIDSTLMKNMPALVIAFADSLNEKQLEPGHLIIGFGAGKWSKQDLHSLQAVLRRTRIVKEGKSDGLTRDIRAIHYGSFVNELVVKIKYPKNKNK